MNASKLLNGCMQSVQHMGLLIWRDVLCLRGVSIVQITIQLFVPVLIVLGLVIAGTMKYSGHTGFHSESDGESHAGDIKKSDHNVNDFGTVGYAPKTEWTQKIIKIMKTQLKQCLHYGWTKVEFKGYTSEAALLKAHNNRSAPSTRTKQPRWPDYNPVDEKGGIDFGLVFRNIDETTTTAKNSTGEADANFDPTSGIEVIFRPRARRARSKMWRLDAMYPPLPDACHRYTLPEYRLTGVNTFIQLVTESIVKKDNPRAPNMAIKTGELHCLRLKIFRVAIPVITVLAFLPGTAALAYRVQGQRYKQGTVMLQLMGVHLYVLVLLDILLVLIHSLAVSALLLMATLGGRWMEVFINYDQNILFPLFLLYGLASNAMSFAVAAFIRLSPNATSGLVIFTSLAQVLPTMYAAYTRNRIARMIISMVFCTTAFDEAIHSVLQGEIQYESFAWSKALSHEDDGHGVLLALNQLAFQVIVFFLLALWGFAFEKIRVKATTKIGERHVGDPRMFVCGHSLPSIKPSDVYPFVEFKGISMSRRHGCHYGLHNIKFDINPGEKVALLGGPASGKTALVNIITGHFQRYAGFALIDDDHPPHYLKKHPRSIGLCPQHNYMNEELTVMETLNFYMKISNAKRQNVTDLLKDFLLDMAHNIRVCDLSQAGIKRLQIAIAYMTDPTFVVLDEPTYGMDEHSEIITENVVRKRKGTTLVCTSYARCALRLADKIVIISQGTVVFVGTPSEVKDAFGVGYLLTIGLCQNCNVESLTTYIRLFVPRLYVLVSSPGTLACMLPDSTSSKFEFFLANLDWKQRRLRIYAFGMDHISLDDLMDWLPSVRYLRARLLQIKTSKESMEEFSLEALLRGCTAKEEPVLIYSALSKSHSVDDVADLHKELLTHGRKSADNEFRPHKDINKIYLNNSNSSAAVPPLSFVTVWEVGCRSYICDFQSLREQQHYFKLCSRNASGKLNSREHDDPLNNMAPYKDAIYCIDPVYLYPTTNTINSCKVSGHSVRKEISATNDDKHSKFTEQTTIWPMSVGCDLERKIIPNPNALSCCCIARSLTLLCVSIKHCMGRGDMPHCCQNHQKLTILPTICTKHYLHLILFSTHINEKGICMCRVFRVCRQKITSFQNLLPHSSKSARTSLQPFCRKLATYVLTNYHTYSQYVLQLQLVCCRIRLHYSHRYPQIFYSQDRNPLNTIRISKRGLLIIQNIHQMSYLLKIQRSLKLLSHNHPQTLAKPHKNRQVAITYFSTKKILEPVFPHEMDQNQSANPDNNAEATEKTSNASIATTTAPQRPSFGWNILMQVTSGFNPFLNVPFVLPKKASHDLQQQPLYEETTVVSSDGSTPSRVTLKIPYYRDARPPTVSEQAMGDLEFYMESSSDRDTISSWASAGISDFQTYTTIKMSCVLLFWQRLIILHGKVFLYAQRSPSWIILQLVVPLAIVASSLVWVHPAPLSDGKKLRLQPCHAIPAEMKTFVGMARATSGDRVYTLADATRTELACGGPVEYNTFIHLEDEYLFGLEFETASIYGTDNQCIANVDSKLFYDFTAYHSETLGIATIMLAYYRCYGGLIPTISADEDTRKRARSPVCTTNSSYWLAPLKLSLEPLPLAAGAPSTDENKQEGGGIPTCLTDVTPEESLVCVVESVSITTALSFLTACFAVMLIKERQSGFLYLQQMCGAVSILNIIPFLTLHVTIYNFCIAFMLVPLALDESPIFSRLELLIMTLVVYACAQLPVIYTTSRMFDHPVLATVTLWLFSSFMGALPLWDSPGLTGGHPIWTSYQHALLSSWVYHASVRLPIPSTCLATLIYSTCMEGLHCRGEIDAKYKEWLHFHFKLLAYHTIFWYSLWVFCQIYDLNWLRLLNDRFSSAWYEMLRPKKTKLKLSSISGSMTRSQTLSKSERSSAASSGGDRMNRAIYMKNITHVCGPSDAERLKNVSLTVERGTVLGIVSGYGYVKTMLLEVLVGIRSPISGHVMLDTKPLPADPLGGIIKQGLSYCPPKDGLMDVLTGRETLTLFAQLRGAYPDDAQRDINILLDLLGLSDSADRLCSTYSDTELKKTRLCTALVGNPSIIVLDEPALGLSYQEIRNLAQILVKHHRSGGTAVIAADMPDVCDSLCTEIYSLKLGGLHKIWRVAFGLDPACEGSRFCNGYLAHVVFKKDDEGNSVNMAPDDYFTIVTEKIVDVDIFSDEQGSALFHFTDRDVNLAKVFSLLEDGKQFYGVNEYTLSRANLNYIISNSNASQEKKEPPAKSAITRRTIRGLQKHSDTSLSTHIN